MEDKNAAVRKQRVRIQQNIITALCLACAVFSVVWSVHAAVVEKDQVKAALKEASSVAKDDSKKDDSKKDDGKKDDGKQDDGKDDEKQDSGSAEYEFPPVPVD